MAADIEWERGVACDFCQGTGPHRVLVGSLVECSCGLRFHDPRWSQSAVEGRFASGLGNAEADCCYGTGRLNARLGPAPEAQKAVLRAMAQGIYRKLCFVCSRPSTDRVYEVGANIGWMLSACRELGADPLSGACDINPRACELGREKLGLLMDCGPFAAVAPPHPPYGTVLANDVIEHTYTPHADLAQMRGLTVPGGALYLKTFLDELDEPLGRPMLDPPWHAYHFTRSTLRRAVERAGWDILVWEEEPAFAQVSVYATARAI